MAESVEELIKHKKLYWWIGAFLLLLTAATVAISYFDFGSHAANVTVGLLIATLKASLVALFFMHLKEEKGLIYRVLAFTFFFFLGLMFLTIWAFADKVTWRYFY